MALVGEDKKPGAMLLDLLYLLHSREPGRSLMFDWLVNAGFAHREDGQWLLWRSHRLEGD
jgi:hypothetical protein